MRILVRPCYADFLNNRLFEANHPYAAHWMTPYVLLRQRAVEAGWEMGTWDTLPLESADIVYVQDLPATRREMDGAKARAPRAKFVLQLLETPLSRAHFFQPRNHDLFDAILTYNWRLCDERRYFRYYLPIGPVSPCVDPPPFEQRTPLVMINSNRWLGIWAQRQKGAAGLPFFGPAFSGWHIPFSTLLNQNRGELYTHRARLARLADRKYPGAFDVYGPGWQGEAASWVHRLVRHRPYACAKGTKGIKAEILPRYRFAISFENVVGDVGYISEKILDALHFGTVPVYLGDEKIQDIIPPDCFVDARQFKNDDELFRFVIDCPKAKWEKMIEAGRQYLASPASRVFSSESFVDVAMNVLHKMADSASSNAPAQSAE